MATNSSTIGERLLRANLGYSLKDLIDLPDDVGLQRIIDPSEHSRYCSTWHNEDVHYVKAYPAICSAIIEFCKGKDSKIALIDIGNGSFSAEMDEIINGEEVTTIYRVAENGTVSGAVINSLGKYSEVEPFGNKNSVHDTAPLFMCFLMTAANINTTLASDLDYLKLSYINSGNVFSWEDTAVFYKINDAIEFGLKDGHINCIMAGGNPRKLTAQQVEMRALDGNTLAGSPRILKGKKTSSAKKDMTFIDAVNLLEKWTKEDDRTFSPEEEMLIPTFPDDYPVLPETIFFCKRYLLSRQHKHPMLNFMWRGTTSYGKSTGIEQMAALLHRPLLRMTCNSTMETQDFLSEIIPNDTNGIPQGSLPDLDEILYFPEGAYEALTGEVKENVTPEEVFAKYTEVVANSKSDHALYKHVKSNYVKALEKGYIVEIQEVSRIKDSGVLVGLNEYDRPGALIPLSDGTFVKRHPDAIVMFSDNVGYASCRPIDPSVLRRIAFIKDSHTLSKDQTLARVKYNTGFDDIDLLNKLYDVYEKIRVYCASNDITEGSVSVSELERWAQSVMMDDYENLRSNCIDCVIRKATSSEEEQDEIINSVLNIEISPEE